jgi:hypothetical protein
MERLMNRAELASSILRTTLLVVLFCGPAAAQPQSWAQIAASFGCTQQILNRPISERAPGQQEYIPAGERENAWSRIYTVTLVATSENEATANAAVDELIQRTRATFQRNGAQVSTFEVQQGNHGAVAFFEFVIGGEPNVGVIHRAAPGLMVIQQVAARGKGPTPEDRRRLRSFIGLRD